MTRRIAARACLCALLAVSLVATASTADPDAEPAPAIRGADPQLLATVRDLGARMAPILRTAKGPAVVALRADPATRAAEVQARAARTLPTSTAQARGRAWADLGLGEGDAPTDLNAALEADLEGFAFDRDRSRLLVDPSRLATTADASTGEGAEAEALLLATGIAPDEPVAAHYLAHLALDPELAGAAPTTDALLARASLAEGGANVAALLLLFSGVGLEREVLAGTLRPEDVLGGRLVPEGMRSAGPVTRHLLEFVYLDGFARAAALAKDGDVRRVASEATRRRSTRDVLHLDRPPRPAVTLTTPVFPSIPSLRPVDRDSLGEQGIVTLVALTTGKDNLALIAGDGWEGDALWRFEAAPGSEAEGVTVWDSQWLTEEDAKDAVYALARSLQARFPSALPGELSVEATVVVRADRIYRLSRSGLGVRLRVASPSTDRSLEDTPKKKGPERP